MAASSPCRFSNASLLHRGSPCWERCSLGARRTPAGLWHGARRRRDNRRWVACCPSPEMGYRGAHARYVHGYDYTWLKIDRDSNAIVVLDHPGVSPFRPLSDPAVVKAANEMWMELDQLPALRGRPPVTLFIDSFYAGWARKKPLDHIPAAYPIAVFDQIHAHGQGVKVPLLYELRLDLPAPAHLRPAPPGSPRPLLVLLICIGVGGLATFAVLSGRRVPVRRGAQPRMRSRRKKPGTVR